jgi:eukaryotic-like serine/threonine-protein kinase
VDGLTALVAGMLAALRGAAPQVCPGNWAWGVSLFGIGVGLLPTVGLLVVAFLRKRIGSRYGAPESAVLVGTGLLTAGLLPLLAFSAAGRVFATAAADGVPSGYGRALMNSLAAQQCFTGPPERYLGVGSVASSFSPAEPLRAGISLVLLVLVPIVTSMFVAAQARIVLRRGPRWPGKAFWIPTLAVAVLTVGTPAGTAGHLWIGMLAASIIGVPVVAMAGAPSADVVARSLATKRPPPPAVDRRPPPPLPAPSAAQQRSAANPRSAANQRSASTQQPSVQQPRTGARPAPPVGLAAAPAAPPPARPPVGRPPTRQMSVAEAAGIPAAPLSGPRFSVVKKLGAGGFGRVWLAHDNQLGHLVALKSAHAPDAETEERIRREAEALAAIRHPNSVRIYDLLPARSDPGLAELDGMVIVMGYVEGTSLGEMVRTQGTLDDVAAARVWFSLAGALDAAHRRGVMHRDIKPGNVIVDPSGFAHLIDFGIARRTGDATMTQAGFVLGTPDFLAPEVACGERATPASDGWQLAATVSYALTGHPPRGTHPDAVSGLRAAASGAKLTHLPQRTAHYNLLRATLDTLPDRRPPLPAVQKSMADWLRQTGVALDGPVTSLSMRIPTAKR